VAEAGREVKRFEQSPRNRVGTGDT
jgi:hypothetical protein